MKRKLFITCVLVTLIFSLIGCGKKSEEVDYGDLAVSDEVIDSGEYTPSDVEFKTYDSKKLFVALLENYEYLEDPTCDLILAIRSNKDEVDLSEYDLKSEDIKKMFKLAYLSNPITICVGYEEGEEKSNEKISTLKLFYTKDKEEINDQIYNFEAKMDETLSIISEKNLSDSEIARECYKYILNNYSFKKLEGVTYSVDAADENAKDAFSMYPYIQNFYSEFENGELSFANANYLYSFLLNQFEIKNVSTYLVGTYFDGIDPVLDDEFTDASLILNNAITVDCHTYLCDLTMDMVLKGKNTVYDPKFFAMGLDTRELSYKVSGNVAVFITADYEQITIDVSKEDLY